MSHHQHAVKIQTKHTLTRFDRIRIQKTEVLMEVLMEMLLDVIRRVGGWGQGGCSSLVG